MQAKLVQADNTLVTTSSPLPVSDSGTAITNIATDIAAINAKLTVDANGNLEVTVKDNDDATQDFDDPVPVGGHIAHDAADSGNPAKIGTRTISSLGNSAAMAAADRSDALSDLMGRLLMTICPPGDLVSGVATITDGSSTAVISAQSASVAVVLMKCFVANTSADVGGYIELKDGTTVKATIPCPAAINSAGAAGAIVDLSPGILGTAATAWNADPSATSIAARMTLIGHRVRV